MTDVVLARVVTQDLTVEIRGPRQPRLGVLGNSTGPAVGVTVHGLDPGDAVTSEQADGTWIDPTGPMSPPLFFEDTRYRLAAIGHTNEAVRLRARDASLLREIDRLPGTQTLAGSINFGRQIGLSDLDFEVGLRRIRLTVEVFPTKVDYGTDYLDLRHDVAASGRALALEYLRSTYTRVGADAVPERSSDLEWLTLLRQEVYALEFALLYVAEHPRRDLAAAVEEVRADRARRPDSHTRRAIARGRGSGPWQQVAGIGPMRSYLPAARRHETLDTHEHRWLRRQLAVVGERLNQIQIDLNVELGEVRARRRTTDRLQAELEEIEAIGVLIQRLEQLEFLTTAVGDVPYGFSSLALIGGAGYGEAYRSLTILRLGLHLDGDVFEASLKDVAGLYESWCFIRLARSMAARLGPATSGDAVAVTSRGLRVNLVRGLNSRMDFASGGRRVTLSYNPTFSGLTGDQRPDIIVEIMQPGIPAMFVVLDAKYRVNADPKYVERYGVPGPPADAVNALHRYRDAIVVDAYTAGLERPVVVGAALYPLQAVHNADWARGPLCDALDALGIGAIPYLPSNAELVDEWIAHLLGMPVGSLAVPGPPFAAYEATRANR